MADRFFTTSDLAPGEFILDGPDAHHLAVVRRFEPGDRVVLFNGDGREFPGRIVEIMKKSVVIQIEEAIAADREVGFPLVVCWVCLGWGWGDFLIEKLVELGATRFIPLSVTRSVVKPKDAKIDKMTRAVIEASKQCGRNRLMEIDGVRTWRELLDLADLPPLRVVLHTDQSLPATQVTNEEISGGSIAAIGPEGGFTAEEIDLAREKGWRTLSLGPRVLRVETAALAWATIPAIASHASPGRV